MCYYLMSGFVHLYKFGGQCLVSKRFCPTPKLSCIDRQRDRVVDRESITNMLHWDSHIGQTQAQVFTFTIIQLHRNIGDVIKHEKGQRNCVHLVSNTHSYHVIIEVNFQLIITCFGHKVPLFSCFMKLSNCFNRICILHIIDAIHYF